MLHFFHRIRKQLAEENKPKKYLRYAFGEIVLVVIGILIALQVNTWNKERDYSKKEKQYLINLQRDIDEQIELINTQIEFENNITILASDLLKKYNQQNKFIIDSIFIESMSSLNTRRTFAMANTTYIVLLSSGNIDIIQNSILKNNLIRLYQKINRMKEIFDKNNNLVDNNIVPFSNDLIYTKALKLNKIYGKEFTVELKEKENLNQKKLQNITIDQLKIPLNELKLNNQIRLRLDLSSINIHFLNELLKETIEFQKELIKELE